MKYIGLISDTHGLFSEAVRNFLSPVDEIWHCGDIGGGLDTMKEIAAFKPLVAVHGNADNFELRFDCPEYQWFSREGVSVLMIHIGGYPGRYSLRAKSLIEQLRPKLFVVVAIWADPTLANEELGWQAERSIEETLASAWAWEKHLAETGK